MVSRLGKATLIVFSIYVLFCITFFVHAVGSGTLLPYPDATPEQLAYERFQNRYFGMPLFFGVGISGLATFVLGLAWVIRWIVRAVRLFRNR